MTMFRPNPILNTDSYKFSHYLQYPLGTTNISSYIESRGGAYDKTVFFGLQAFLKAYMTGEETKITRADVDDAKAVVTAHGLPFNEAGFRRISDKHKGRWPVLIEAVDEGSVVPTGNVLVQVVNTDPELPWVTSYIETQILRAIWYPTTVATRSWYIKQIIKKYLEETADNLDMLPFKLHDFGFRGVSSWESAMLGGMGHLVNFMGTDTVAALEGCRALYDEPMAGFSIPAAEHSTITSWGRYGERDAFENMIDKFGGPGKLVAVVSDSYDIHNACRNIWGTELKEKVKSHGGLLVVRPDSGIPASIVHDVISILGDRFKEDVTTNSKGYRMLPPYLRVIQGDGINEHTIKEILERLKQNFWSADNVVFGMGGELLQTMNRDTLKWAMKANAISFNEGRTWEDVSKKPKTDEGKSSKPGRLALVRKEGKFLTMKKDHMYPDEQNLLQTRFNYGCMFNLTSMKAVRERSNS